MTAHDTYEQIRERYDGLSTEELAQRTAKRGHAVQSGVAAMMSRGDTSTEPKHLRTGVNMALCETSALQKILVDKGIISDREVLEYLNYFLDREVESYEKRIDPSGRFKLA